MIRKNQIKSVKLDDASDKIKFVYLLYRTTTSNIETGTLALYLSSYSILLFELIRNSTWKQAY